MDEILWHRRETRRHRENKPRPVAAGASGLLEKDCSNSCGDGVLDDNERCDTAITAGPGVCPTLADCDDKNDCTTDDIIGASCNTECNNPPITVCSPTSDGCCPTGCTDTTDADCLPTCGNGELDDGEQCDTAITAGPGGCPTLADCDDNKDCTIDDITAPGSCSAVCRSTEKTRCDSKSDDCCPLGCTALTDIDCSPTCDNGAVEGNEKCDTGILAGSPGACPIDPKADCEQRPCTLTTISGGGCSAECAWTEINSCSGSVADACCPTGCIFATDSDCPSGCGDGVRQDDEACDTAIPAGEAGACPQSCASDGKPCTDDTLVGGGCTAHCPYAEIKNCQDNDGCCPPGCNANNDADCDAVCDNGVWEQGDGELCDTRIPQGQEGACPTFADCNDDDACTDDKLVDGGTCLADCKNSAITTCTHGDGCCPPGCDATDDEDCSAVCGNKIVEPPDEACDTAIPAGDEGACPTSCPGRSGCTVYTLRNAGTCQASCHKSKVTTCSRKGLDECCPEGCKPAEDLDCCLKAGCTDSKDGCCPPTCSASTDADCKACSGTETCGLLDGCCPARICLPLDPDCTRR
jgi:hypothetical protein